MTLLDLLDNDVDDHMRHGQWRLARVEIVNWGTFCGHARIDVARQGHLFTGASGSGKSSLLDAIAAVLTPDRWLRLNAAAQDGNSRLGDRSLMTYVRGAWTKEVDEDLDRATTVYLRPRATWSGILLRFENRGDEPITLVRLFHAPGTRTEATALKNSRIFHRGELNLLDLRPFVENGIDARKVKNAFPDALITTGNRHGRFHERVVRQFGFRSITTLHLLHKTQSAKGLGTLNALFRGFMLDEPATFGRAVNAVEQFTELDRAYSHVVDLREQVEALERINAAVSEYDSAHDSIQKITALQEAVEPFTAAASLQIARDDLGPAKAHQARAESTRSVTQQGVEAAESALETARSRVRDEGGARVELLRERIAAARKAEETTEREQRRLADELARIDAPVPADSSQFAELRGEAEVRATREIAAVDYAIRDAAAQSRRRLAQVESEIHALRTHRSNLSPALLEAREFLAKQVGIPSSALPFAAELVSVLPEHADWRGALERVLRPLATTLLVPQTHLRQVRQAADSQNLGTRVVIEAVPGEVSDSRRPRDSRSLVHRLDVADSPFAPFLRRQLVTRFDYTCVDHPDDLDEVDRGVTRTGLVKGNARRYIKDDRTRIDDQTQWVLGGDTEERLDALLTQLRQARAERDSAAKAELEADSLRDVALRQREVYQRIAVMTWEQIDTAGAVAATAALRADLESLTSASSTLREAEAARQRAEEQMIEAKGAHERAIEEHSRATREVMELQEHITELEDRHIPEIASEVAEELELRFRNQRRSLTLKTIGEIARSVQSRLSQEKDAASGEAQSAARSFTAGVTAFAGRWETVVAGAELTTGLEDRYGFRNLRDGIISRGLPEKEGEFRRLLRERSRDVVAHLLDDLRSAPALVRDRVLPVNASLAQSPFEGRDNFLEIDVKTTRTNEVEEFLGDLRRIVEGNWAEESAESAEDRFAVLKQVIGRLGSQDRVDLDWRTRVLDTRLHVSFLARERRPDGGVVRVYDSSEGLSGGQRQKLVNFCLAAALRYQLTDDENDLPKFGSILIDEAFDKADSTYTRNAMDVFQSFGFHMILATPQKLLQTLEPYVGAITAVSNPERNRSYFSNVVYEVDDTGSLPDNGESGAAG